LQIGSDGAYSQHSTNYQRLMLQLALWMNALARMQGRTFPVESRSCLAQATRWLLDLMDHESGTAPNLGPNDGAYILPLTVCPFADYRPVLQAAGLAFLGQKPIQGGVWDELSLWLCPETHPDNPAPDDKLKQTRLSQTPHILVSPGGESWAYLRAAHFENRPGHADQLHLDLWWHGLNIALDPGSYLYNAPPPWDNRLVESDVHNTLTVDGQDQMLRAGRFLYLDRAQALVTAGTPAHSSPYRVGAWSSLTAQHDGYHRLGLSHRRIVTALPSGGWLVEDSLLPKKKPSRSDQPHTASLHWLLPDWPWQVQTATTMQFVLSFESPRGIIRLYLLGKDAQDGAVIPTQLQLVRCGELLYGSGVAKPTWGWFSPTYGEKMPALSLRLLATRLPPIILMSEWLFPIGDHANPGNPKNLAE
jgi:hypothetical protein